MKPMAFRGGTQLADEVELRAHLASLLRVENIGVLLGAGASACAGGLTMKALWSDFLWLSPAEANWLLGQGFITLAERRPGGPVPLGAPPPPPPPPPSSAPPPASTAVIEPKTVNIEALADSLEIAITEWRRQGNPLLADGERARAALLRAVIRAAKLKEAIWTSQVAEPSSDGLSTHRALLQKIIAARQPGQGAPWIFTTNYDLAVEWAAESIDLQVINGFLGLHARRFSPQSFDLGFRNTQAKGEARFGSYNIYLAKLHGSMTWKEVDGELFELPASQAWGEIKQFLDGHSADLGYRVLPRAAKYLQTVGYVLGELLRRFAEFMARPQTTLIVAGYGFGDEHVNRLIRSALLNPTLQVVVYLPEFSGDIASNELPPTVRRLLALQSPRLTIVGGGPQAYLTALVDHLPEPALFDEDLSALERRLRPRDADPLSQLLGAG